MYFNEWADERNKLLPIKPQKESLRLACGTISIHPTKTGGFDRKIC